MSNLILAVTVTCAAGSTAATIAGNPMKGDGLAPTVTEGAWLIVNMGGGVFAQVPVAADATADNALTLLHPLPGAVTGVQGWVAVDPDKDSVAIATMQAVQAIRARFTPASVWFTGNGPPSNDIGFDGDLYRDYDESPPIEYRRDNGAWGISPAATVLPWNARGDWVAGTTYAKQDLVTYNGSSWLSRIDANTGNAPTTAAAQWQLVARSGDQILIGVGAPAAGLGVDGAAYINTSNGDLYKKAAGAWGAPQGSIRGPQGIAGPANTLAIGTVATGPAAATITGASPNQILNLTVPKGDTGPANTLAIGTVASGASAGATITGTAPNQALNLTLPKGDTGNTGPAGLTPKGAWSSATAYVVNDLVTSGGSSYRCKVAHTNQAVTNTTYWELFAQKGADGTGAGDVVGPATAADSEVVIFDTTTGKKIKSSGVQWSIVSRLDRDQTYTQPQRFADAVFSGSVYFNGAAYIAARPLGDSSPWLASTGFVQQELNSHFTDSSNYFRYQKTAAGTPVAILAKNLSSAADSQAHVQWETGRSNVYGYLYLKNDAAAGGFMGLVGGPNVKQFNFSFDELLFYNNAGQNLANLNGSGMGLKAGSLYYIGGIPLGYGAGLQGFGDAATKSASSFATAAQGAKADTAVQPAALSAYEKAGEQVGINTQTGTTYTLVLADKGKIVEMNNAGANTLTIPPNSSVAFPVNSRIDLSQFGAGQTTIAAGAGVTIRAYGNKLKLSGQYAGATLYKRDSDEWVLVGDLVT